jgi:hypothetical protein
MKGVRILILLTGALLIFSCGRPSEEDCTKACENLSKVAVDDYLQKKDISKDAVEESQKKLAEISSKDIPNCLEECRKKGTKEQTTCLISAKTLDEVKKCK